MGRNRWQVSRIDELRAPTDGAIAIGPFGSRMKSDTYVPIGVPVIRGNNIGDTQAFVGEMVCITDEMADTLGNAIVHAGDLVFPHRGAIGQVGIVPDDTTTRFALSSSLMKLTCNRKVVEPKFLFYFFRSSEGQYQLLKNASTVGTPGIGQPLASLRAIQVPVPPLSEQRAIADILGSLDDKIELNRRMNVTLEAMARALFKSWFVDFDPVRAKMDGRAPAGMDAATAALFPARLVDSELGPIPEGWRVESVYAVANVVYGAPFASSQFNSTRSGYPLIRIRDLRDEAPSVFTTEIHPKGRLVVPGDIVVGMDGEFRAHVWGGPVSYLNQRLCVFEPTGASCKAHVWNAISAPLARVEATETATTVIHLGKNDIDRFRVVIPDAPIMNAYRGTSEPILNQYVQNKIELRTLANIRDTLLPKLLSGELAVGGNA